MVEKTRKNAWLTEALRKNGHTQTDLAKRWGLSHGVVSRYVTHGDQWLTEERIQIISEMTSLTPDQIVELDGRGGFRRVTPRDEIYSLEEAIAILRKSLPPGCSATITIAPSRRGS